MAIKIIESPDVYITRSQYNDYVREWEAVCRYLVNPPKLDEWIEKRERIKCQTVL